MELEITKQPESINIHSELKKLPLQQRLEILNSIRIEEEKEHAQEQANAQSQANVIPDYQAIITELRLLRIQVKNIQSEIMQLSKNNTCNNKYNKYSDKYTNDEYDYNCNSIISLVSEWMPIWIFLAFFIFALTGKSKLSSGICPMSGDIFTSI